MSAIDEIFARAKALHKAGQVAEAEPLYRQVLAGGDATAEAWYLHGAACQALNLPGEALASLQQAVRLNPQEAGAWHYLGIVQAQLGQLPAAAESLGRASRLLPDAEDIAQNLRFASAALLNQQGAEHSAAARFTSAATCLQQAVALAPDDPALHYNLGLVLSKLDRHEEAVAGFRSALKLQPDHAQALFGLGNALHKLGQLDVAIETYRRLLSVKQNFAEAHLNLGNVFKQQGKLDEAITCYRRALELSPNSAPAHNNLGAVLADRQNLAEAQACYERALAIAPNHVEAHVNFATLLLMQGHEAEAHARLLRAIELDPRHAKAHYNLAYVQGNGNQLDAALASYKKAIALDPQDADAHFGLANILLAMGRFPEGWPQYEWRWQQKGKEISLPIDRRWSGDPLVGRRILLWTEQGLGDALQFVRYARLLKQQGANVIVLCRQPLAEICARAEGIDEVVVAGQTLPAFDVHAPLLTLPGLLGTTLDNIPAHVPYLHVEDGLIAQWRETFADERRLKVGIAWRGNPENRSDPRRSIPLAEFAPLAEVPNVRLYSLQFAAGRDELAPYRDSWPLVDLGEQLGDFHRTAALVKNLDLVITCDSAPAHLAGALGAPVWVALAFAPDWRWMLDRHDSPWYPTMRLFRQTAAGDWKSVFAQIALALANRSRRASGE